MLVFYIARTIRCMKAVYACQSDWRIVKLEVNHWVQTCTHMLGFILISCCHNGKVNLVISIRKSSDFNKTSIYFHIDLSRDTTLNPNELRTKRYVAQLGSRKKARLGT